MPESGRVALLCVLLSGCAATGAGQHDGRYVGEVTPRPTIPGAQCGEPARGLLDVRGDAFVFAPDEGVLVVPGRLGPDGSLHGVLALHGGGTALADVPDQAGRKPPGHANAPAPQMTFDGRLDGARVTGVLAEPRCSAAVSLERR